MLLRICLSLSVLAFAASGAALAQTDTRGQATKPPAASPPPPGEPQSAAAAGDKGKPAGHLLPVAPSSAVPEIITDPSRLPAPVARTRERILAAARSGDLQQLAALVNEAIRSSRSPTKRTRSPSGRRVIPIPTASRCSPSSP